MKKNELFSFIRKFNEAGSIEPSITLEGLKTLPEEDHELLMLLVNYKNGEEFIKNLK